VKKGIIIIFFFFLLLPFPPLLFTFAKKLDLQYYNEQRKLFT